ncbi:11834_t:CDS:1, partial [Dentiscutata heterogama]
YMAKYALIAEAEEYLIVNPIVNNSTQIYTSSQHRNPISINLN